MAFLTSLQNSIKKIDKNYLLVFLIILIGFVIVDCNTKMFSKMFEGNANINNTSCIDLFITNCHKCFQNTTTVSTGLSDFHKMIVTIMKNTIPKSTPKIIQYRDYKKFVVNNFRLELK